MMKPSKLMLAGIVVVATTGTMANASVLYSNPPDLTGNQTGDCLYNTTCAQLEFPANSIYAAQEFILSNTATVTSAGFNSIITDMTDGTGTAVNFFIFNANGNVPGTQVDSGNALVTATNGPVGANFPTTDYAFDITPLTLSAGSYYLAIQLVTSNFFDYLSMGVASSGDAQSYDGGLTWRPGYATFNLLDGCSIGDVPNSNCNGPSSVAISVRSVPEPATLALIGLGLAGLGFNKRKKA